MKTYTVFISLCVSTIFLIFTINAYAVKHIVLVGNFSFNPATVNTNVGDTMRWVWSAGNHTTTSITIPGGAATWDAPITTANRSFEYKITVAGNYSYFCKIHGLGMSGTFSAANITPTLSVTPINQNVTSTSGSTTFTVTSNSAWTAISNAGWCESTIGGNGNGSITANYSTNPAAIQRIASITVTVPTLPDQTVTVTQEGAPALIALASTTTDTIIVGQTAQLDVTVTGGTGIYDYSWTSDPVGFTSTNKNPTDTPVSTTSYTCEVVSGDQTVNSTIAVYVIPVPVLFLENDTIFSGQSVCYSASQTITVAGNGNPFIVEDGGHATMVSGQNILYLPGTLVNYGGYMLGYVTSNGQYCNTPVAPLALALQKVNEIPKISAKPFFKIYPNPTDGLFTIELDKDATTSSVIVDVFGLLGEPVINEKFNGESRYVLSLGGKQAGVYYIRLISDNRNETMKILKK